MTDAKSENVVDIHSNVAKELLDQMNALYALSKTHECLAQGYFQPHVGKYVEQAIEFIKNLHAQTLEEALRHPDATKIAKLNQVIEFRALVKKDGVPSEQN